MKNKKLLLIFTMCLLCFCFTGCAVSTGAPIRISSGQTSNQPVQMESVTIDTSALNRVFELTGQGQEIDLQEIEHISQNGVKHSGFEIVQQPNNAIGINLGGTNSRKYSQNVIQKDGFITIDIRTDNIQDFFNMYLK